MSWFPDPIKAAQDAARKVSKHAEEAADNARRTAEAAAEAVSKSAGEAAQAAQNLASDMVTGAQNAVCDAAGAMDDAVKAGVDSVANISEQAVQAVIDQIREMGLPKPDYAGKITNANESIETKSISVKRLKTNPDGKSMLCQDQRLRLSANGVELMGSDGQDAKVVKVIPVRNCYLETKKAKGENPLVALLAGTALSLALTNPIGIILGMLMVIPSESSCAEIIQYGTDERYIFVLNNRTDGDTLLQFLDENMSIID